MKAQPRLGVWIVLATVFFTTLIALTVVYRSELRASLVLPLQTWLQDAWQNWLGMDSGFRWSLFVILLGALIFLTFPAPDRSQEKSSQLPRSSAHGRLAFWRSELKILLGRGYANRFSVFELRRLVLEVVGFRQQLSADEAESWLRERLESGEGDVPAAMHWLVGNAFTAPVEQPAAATIKFGDFLRALLGFASEQPKPPEMFDIKQVEMILCYLEKMLEVTNEDNDNP